MSDTFCEVEGFHPSSEEHKSIRIHLERIINFAPSDASIHLKLGKAKEIFEGIVNVNGTLERFKAKQTAQSLQHLLSNLSGQILDQMKNWKKTRLL